jgi:hypothetical protein
MKSDPCPDFLTHRSRAWGLSLVVPAFWSLASVPVITGRLPTVGSMISNHRYAIDIAGCFVLLAHG